MSIVLLKMPQLTHAVRRSTARVRAHVTSKQSRLRNKSDRQRHPAGIGRTIRYQFGGGNGTT